MNPRNHEERKKKERRQQLLADLQAFFNQHGPTEQGRATSNENQLITEYQAALGLQTKLESELVGALSRIMSLVSAIRVSPKDAWYDDHLTLQDMLRDAQENLDLFIPSQINPYFFIIMQFSQIDQRARQALDQKWAIVCSMRDTLAQLKRLIQETSQFL